MKAHLIVWGFIAVLLSISVAAFGHNEPAFFGDLINLNQYDDQILNPYGQGNFFPGPYSPLINPSPEPYFTRDLAVDIFRFEAPAGTKVGDYITFIGTIKNNGMFAAPLNYAFFINGESLGPAVPQEASRYWDGVVTFIQPGESRMVVKSIQLTREGDNSIQLKADPFNLIGESRENNNVRSIRIVAQPAEQPQPPQNNPPADNQNNVPPQNNPPANNPPQDNNQNNNQPQDNNGVTRAEARTAVRDAGEKCTAASNAVDRARNALSRNVPVSFDRKEVERQDDTLGDAKKAIRDADNAYDDANYADANTKAETAEKKCERIVRKLAFTDNVPEQQPAVNNYNYVPPQPAARAEQPEPADEDDVQLIKASIPVKDDVPVEDDAGTPWLIFGVIVGAFLVLGELATLAYFVFRK